jgi:hypothetical protein
MVPLVVVATVQMGCTAVPLLAAKLGHTMLPPCHQLSWNARTYAAATAPSRAATAGAGTAATACGKIGVSRRVQCHHSVLQGRGTHQSRCQLKECADSAAGRRNSERRARLQPCSTARAAHAACRRLGAAWPTASPAPAAGCGAGAQSGPAVQDVQPPQGGPPRPACLPSSCHPLVYEWRPPPTGPSLPPGPERPLSGLSGTCLTHHLAPSASFDISGAHLTRPGPTRPHVTTDGPMQPPPAPLRPIWPPLAPSDQRWPPLAASDAIWAPAALPSVPCDPSGLIWRHLPPSDSMNPHVARAQLPLLNVPCCGPGACRRMRMSTGWPWWW